MRCKNNSKNVLAGVANIPILVRASVLSASTLKKIRIYAGTILSKTSDKQFGN